MLVLIGGLLVVSFLYFVSVMKEDDAAVEVSSKGEKLDNKHFRDNWQTPSPHEGSMECSRSNCKFVCSKCGSRPIAIKIEQRVEESTTTSCEIVEENTVENAYESLFQYCHGNCRRVPFPEAGVDIVDRKLKNTDESLEKEIGEYASHEGEILTYTESWTENWLFRKTEARREAFKPVSMFVPNTTAKYRAMIGDQNVDELSDLSECCNDSDADLEELARESGDETTPTTPTKRKVRNGLAKYIYDQRSRVLLDGKSKHHREYNIDHMCFQPNGYCHSSTLPDTLLDGQSINPLGEAADVKDEPKYRSPEAFDSAALSLAANQNSTNGAQTNRSRRAELFAEAKDANQSSLPDDKLSDIDFNLFSPPKPGTYADREHRKWQTAAPLENNPYSEENLQKRLLEKKYTPKYSSASSLLGIARLNGLDDGIAVDASKFITNEIDFETIDLPEKSSVNNTPIIELNSKATEEDVVGNRSTEKLEITRAKESQSNGIYKDEAKNKSYKSKCSNREAIKVTKKNASINEVDYSSSDSREEKITLPSVKRLVQVFSTYQRAREIVEQKDKNTSEPEINRTKFTKVERIQQSPRPLHLHSLTARSLSKEFREGLR